MNIHGRCQSCIVNLNSHDTVLYDNLAPLAVGALVFRQQGLMPVSIARTSRSASATDNPSPLRSAGRVIVFGRARAGVPLKVAPLLVERLGDLSQCRFFSARAPRLRFLS